MSRKHPHRGFHPSVIKQTAKFASGVAVNISPELLSLAEEVKECLVWKDLGMKYWHFLPRHIHNYTAIVEHGIKTHGQIDMADKNVDEFMFRLHESIYQENVRALSRAVQQMAGLIRLPPVRYRWETQVHLLQNTYNRAIERLDKWDSWRNSSGQSWAQAFSIIACAHGCIMTSVFGAIEGVGSASAEAFFPLAVIDVLDAGVPPEVLILK